MDLGDPYDISRDIDVVYTRLPSEVVRWRHRKLYEDAEVSVSAFYEGDLPRPITARGEVIIEKRFYGITYFLWDEWFNIIAIYDEGLEFRGYYCDIMTPVQKSLVTYSATDLFLDFFFFPDGSYSVEDEEEFKHAVEEGLIDEGIERNAREALQKLVGMAESGEFPPEVVRSFPQDPVSILKQTRFQ